MAQRAPRTGLGEQGPELAAAPRRGRVREHVAIRGGRAERTRREQNSEANRGADSHGDSVSAGPCRGDNLGVRWLRLLSLVLFLHASGGCVAISIHAKTRPSELHAELAALPSEWVAVESADGTTLRGIWVEQDGPPVLVLYGSGMTINSTRFMIQVLHHAGYGVLCCDYRGVGRSDGRRSSRRLDDDARALWEWMVREKAKGGPAGVVGISIGAVAATGLLDHPQAPRAVVLERLVDPRTVIRRFLSRSTHVGAFIASLVVRPSIDVDVRAAVANAPVDTLLLLPEDDYIMPARDTKRIVDNRSPKVDVATMPGGHLSSHLLAPARWRGTLLDFLDGHLRPDLPQRNREVPPDPIRVAGFEADGRNLTVELAAEQPLPDQAMLMIFGRTGNRRVIVHELPGHRFRIRLPWLDCRRLGKIFGVRMVRPDFPRPYGTRFLRGMREPVKPAAADKTDGASG